ncbi:type IV pilus modification protein PilV [Halomonas sp. WWR20]
MRQAGVSLIESLIALLLISIALLGVAALQLTTLRDARDARWRIEAVSLAAGLLERVRASPNNVAGFAVASGDTQAAACGSDADICNSVADWLNAVSTQLPHGLAAVTVNGANGVYHVTISLQWRQAAPSNEDPLPSCGVDSDSGGCVILESRL